MGILRVFSLKKFFGGIRAVDGVSFTINKNEIVGLIGPNGSGKTTLFNVITGVYKPDEGEIYFMGERIDGLAPHEIFKKGIIRNFQIPRTFNKLTVYENALLPIPMVADKSPVKALFRRFWIGDEVDNAKRGIDVLNTLEILEVAGNWASKVSGGQMKLTEISRIFMYQPKLVLLDEPAAGVAPALAHKIFGIIREMREKYDLTFFIIEHRLDILFEYVDRVMVMHQGKIIAEGTPSEVVENPAVEEAYLGS